MYIYIGPIYVYCNKLVVFKHKYVNYDNGLSKQQKYFYFHLTTSLAFVAQILLVQNHSGRTFVCLFFFFLNSFVITEASFIPHAKL